MNIYLSECFEQLASDEIKRLQKLLKVILRNATGRAGLKRTLANLYRSLGAPSDVLDRMEPGARDVFLKLLKNFGFLPAERLTEEEKQHLQKNPYTLWLDERICTVSGEARDQIAHDPRFRGLDFLFVHLRNLPPKEKKAWAGWLGVDNYSCTDRDRAGKIYSHLAIRRCSVAREQSLHDAYLASCRKKEMPHNGATHNGAAHNCAAHNGASHNGASHNGATIVSANQTLTATDTTSAGYAGLFLDQFFPDDPMKHPVSWYYRDILPLYDALAETEKRNALYTEEARRLVLYLKIGWLVVQPAPAVFGEKQRYRLVATRELSAPELPEYSAFWNRAEKARENFLF